MLNSTPRPANTIHPVSSYSSALFHPAQRFSALRSYSGYFSSLCQTNNLHFVQVCFSFGFLSSVCFLLPPPPSRFTAATWLARAVIADAWEETVVISVARDDCSSLSCWPVVLLLRLLPLVIMLAAADPSVAGIVVGGPRSMRSSMWASCNFARSSISAMYSRVAMSASGGG